MALFSRVTNWVSNQVLTAAALNGEFNNILTNAQLSSWVGFSANVGQMQQTTSPGGVGTESLAASGSDELQRLRYMFAAVTGLTQWYQVPFRTLTGSFGQVVSSTSTGSFTTTSNSLTDITNATLSITTHGRPVFIGMLNDGNSDTSSINMSQSSTGQLNINGGIALFSNNGGGYAQVMEHAIGGVLSTVTSQVSVVYPPSSFWHIDTPAAGTWSYKLQGFAAASSTLSVTNCKLIAYEF